MRIKIRKTFSNDSPNIVREAFKNRYRYDPLSGEIHSKINGRKYETLSYKGYRRDIYLVVDNTEYRVTYHRLCWFLYYNEVVPKDVQVDHINNIKDDNRINNLQLCSNDQNIKKQSVRKDNKTGYKGISLGVDWHRGKKYEYFYCTIMVDKKLYRIGRFKDVKIAATYYDSANRFYFKEFSKCNFDEVIIPPMSCEDLRVLKKKYKH